MQFRPTSVMAIAAVILPVSSNAEAASAWRLAGTTYNSVAFVDIASVRENGSNKAFTALRVSGQPAKDGWNSVVQKLTVECDSRTFTDAGSIIEQSDGSLKRYPGSGASQKAVSRGIFFDMFEIVCQSRNGTPVADPRQWTLKNFKVGS